MIALQGNKIAVRPIFDPARTRAGLWIPDEAMERCDQGIIKYVSTKIEEKGELKIGDYVLFSGYTGSLVHIEDEGLLIIFDGDFALARILPPGTEVPGLYFISNEGTYFPATYEQAFEIIAQAVSDADWHRSFDVRSLTPRIINDGRY